MVTATKPSKNLDRATRTERKIQIYNRQGWYPVSWRHHPPEIRNLIRMLGFRPQMKCCYMNSQRLFIGNQHYQAGLDLQYREGWIQTVIPIQHAWLLYKGEVLDLTLDSRETHYLESIGSTLDQVLAHLIWTRTYSPVRSEREAYQISPWREAMERHHQQNK
jgi:hypothetical protein